MVAIRKIKKRDVPILFDMAMSAFQPDYERYGVYPPLLKVEKKSFFPPLIFGKVILVGDTMVGGAFVVGMGKKGEIGSIFIDPVHQHKGYGRQVMLAIETMYPKVKRWKLDTPAGSVHLHCFYESLGYIKTGEMKDPKSGMVGFVYEKHV